MGIGRRTRSILVSLSILVLAIVVIAPLSRAQVVRISKSVLLLPQQIFSLPQKVLSLSPKVLRGALPANTAGKQMAQPNSVVSGVSYHNDISPPLSEMKAVPFTARPEHEANL